LLHGVNHRFTAFYLLFYFTVRSTSDFLPSITNAKTEI
jgi:hypothetical protein